MDAVTYPQEAVIQFVNHNVIPLRVGFDEQPIASDFGISWTPALLILDKKGKEHHRTIGFMEAVELLSSLELGIGKMHYGTDKFEKAITSFENVLKEHSGSDAAPEAVFLKGVSRYKSTHNPLFLKEAYEYLLREYPESAWTKRAYPYRLL